MKGAFDVSVLDEFREMEERVRKRMRELAPAAAEYQELQAIAQRLSITPPEDDASATPSTNEPAANGRARRTSKRAATPAGPPGGTRAAGAERRERVVSLIAGQPGITVPELSERLSVDPPPLYRVVRKLRADGVVDKRGKGLHLR